MVKDSLDTVTKWIIGLLAIGFILIIFLVVFGNLSSSTIYGDNSESGLDVNISRGPLTNDSFVLFASATTFDLTEISCSLFNITNQTDHVLIGTGNYTIGGTGNCYIQGVNGSSVWFNGSTFNSTYSYSFNNFIAPIGVIGNFTEGVLTFSGFFNTLFTAAAIFAVLAIFIALLMLVISIRKKVKDSGNDKF